jgi:hypothetical protein
MKQNKPFSTLKTDLQEIFLSKTNSILQENNVLDAAASNIDDFLWTDTCVSSPHLKRSLVQTEPIFTMKYLNCSKYTFQKLTQFSQGKNMLDTPASNTDGFFQRYTCVINLLEYAYLEQNEPFSNLKVLMCRKNSFHKLTQFSQVNNVLDAPASNSDGFLLRDTCISTTSLNRPSCNKMSHSSH